MNKYNQTLKNALWLLLGIDIIQQVLTYLCFGFILQNFLKVVSSNFPKYWSISLSLCTAVFPIKCDKNEKHL